MSVDERTRRDMYTGLEAALGAPVADAVMAHLPPAGWADVARTHDVEMLRVDLGVLRDDTVSLGGGLRGEMAALGGGLRGEMAALGDGLRGEIAQLGDDVRREMAALGDGLRREMISMEERIGLRIDARVASETNRLLLFLIPTMTTIVGLAFAAAKLS